jgi:catechol 2,3-dioxygenase-like lactoylglutathione lyase family enzyme
MRITGIDHVYAETSDWDATTAFWHGLGFEFTSRWGDEGHRAGRLECGDAAVVIAEIPVGQRPGFTAFFRMEDGEGFEPGDRVEVVAPLEDTHWGTQWIRVADPEGRVHALESRPEH